MKTLLSLILSILLSTGSFVASIYAADTTQKINHYTLSAPVSAKVGEAITITVEARDQADKVISNYRGSIFFQSSTDFGATLPAQGKSVTFKESDNGVIKLSNSVIFKRVGPQTLTVTDAQEDADGSVTINVEAGDAVAPTAGSGETMEIITPENNSSITSDTVTVSGKTKKNSKVNITLNGTLAGTVLSNESGVFTKTLSNLTQKSNILDVAALDGTNTTIASAQSKFELAGNTPNFLGLTINPTVTEVSTPVNLLVEADPSLSEAKIMIDGSAIKGVEKTPGKYSFDITAPAKAGTYPVQVILTNNLAQTTTKDNAGILTTNEKTVVNVPSPKFKNLKASTEGTRVKFNFAVENITPDTTKFKITYGSDANNLSEEAMTNSADSIKNADGTYSWYIDGLAPKTYAFKVFGVRIDGSVDQNIASEVVSATIGTPQCSIANVGDISVETTADKSILSWGSISGAVSYNLYKVTPAGDYELVQNLKDNKYVLFLSSGSLAYENFAVKALCDDKTESPKASKVTKVQTGPGMIAILVIISALFGVYVMRRRFI